MTKSSSSSSPIQDQIQGKENQSDEKRKRRRILIVGAGVGGLAVASRIGSELINTPVTTTKGGKENSWEITVLEKNPENMVGGRCGSFYVDTEKYGRFRHERGPSLLLLKEEYLDLFQSCYYNSQKKDSSTSFSYERLKEDFGLDIKQCIPAYQVVFEDGDAIQLGFPSSHDNNNKDITTTISMEETKSRNKMNQYEENGAEKWDEYMRATSAFLDCGLPNFIEEKLDLMSFPSFLREALRDWGKAWPLKPHSDVLDAIFESDKMKALASFQDLYVGLEPFRNDDELIGGGVLRKTAPAVFGLLAALELHPTNKKAGVFAPVGGFQAVSKAMVSLSRKNGCEIMFDSEVTRIDSNGLYARIKNDSGSYTEKYIEADIIVVNADLPFATKSLFSSSSAAASSLSSPSGSSSSRTKKGENKPIYDWDDRYDYSSGVIAFHWSLKKRLDALNTHNVFLCGCNRSDAEKSWRILRNNNDDTDADNTFAVDEPFNFYVHRAGKTDPSAAPKDCDSIMVLVPTNTLVRKEEYSKIPREDAIEKYKEQFSPEYIQQVREAVLIRLKALKGLDTSIPLEEYIIDEVVDTPSTYASFYNVGAGVPFALSHGFNQLSITRPGAESTDEENVLFVGASSRPGNGVPLVMIGAKSVAKKVLKRIENLDEDLKKNQS